MPKQIKIIIAVVIVLLGLATFSAVQKKGVDPFGSAGIEGTYSYTSSGDTVVIKEPAIFHRMIVGSAVTSAEISILDSDTTTGSTTIVKFDEDDLVGVYDIGAYCTNGITVVSSGQTNYTIIFSPR